MPTWLAASGPCVSAIAEAERHFSSALSRISIADLQVCQVIGVGFRQRRGFVRRLADDEGVHPCLLAHRAWTGQLGSGSLSPLAIGEGRGGWLLRWHGPSIADRRGRTQESAAVRRRRALDCRRECRPAHGAKLVQSRRLQNSNRIGLFLLSPLADRISGIGLVCWLHEPSGTGVLRVACHRFS